MSDPILQKLDEIKEDIVEVKAELAPVTKFYHQATGVLSIVKWLGFGGVVAIGIFLARFVGL